MKTSLLYVSALCIAVSAFQPAAAIAQAATAADQQLFLNVEQLLQQNKTDDALKLLGDTIAAGGSATAYALRCEVYTKLQKFDAAKPDCDKALQLDPNLPLAHANKGDLLYDSGDIKGSLAEYTAYVTMSPDAPGAWWRRCDARRRTEDWAGAQADCDKAFALSPGNALIRLSRGRIELHSQQYDKAYQDFDAAVTGLPGDTVALYWRGYTALQMKRYDQAVADFTSGIKLGDESPDTYSNRALAYVGLGKKDLAKADFEKAIALDQKYHLCKEAFELAIQEAVSLGGRQTVGLDPLCK